MKVLRKMRQYFKRKQEVSTDKRGTEEDGDSNIEGAVSNIEVSLNPPLRKRRSSESDLFAQRKQEHQEQLKQNVHETTFRGRSRFQTMSCDSYFAKDQMNDSCFLEDPRLTEKAKDLSPEQMLALELDIFKPLDFYEILFNRMKAKDNGEAPEEETFGTVYHLS